MEYTTRPPATPGYYWLKVEGLLTSIVLCGPADTTPPTVYCVVAGDSGPINGLDRALWSSEPIPEPEE